jgi:hypothetical protein
MNNAANETDVDAEQERFVGQFLRRMARELAEARLASVPSLTAPLVEALRMTNTCHSAFASDQLVTEEREELVSLGLAWRAQSGWSGCARYMRTDAGHVALVAHKADQ